MKLADYLTKHGLSAADFATLIGKDKSTVSRWVDSDSTSGKAFRPSWDTIKLIVEVTGGAVTANDFMDQPVDNSTGNGRAA